MSVGIIDQQEYLKKYLEKKKQNKSKEKKKKKSSKSKGFSVIDESLDLKDIPIGFLEDDCAPTIAEVTYENEKAKLIDEFQSNKKKWKSLNSDAIPEDKIEIETNERGLISIENKRKDDTYSKADSCKFNTHNKQLKNEASQSPKYDPRTSRRKRHDSDTSPLRQKRHDSDTSPPRQRKRHDSDTSPLRRKRDNSDTSPPRQKSHDSDTSPPRQRKRHDSDTSSPRRKRHDSDTSPPRQRKRHDSDTSPLRRKRNNSDTSPPRQKRHDSDTSPPRRKRHDFDMSTSRQNRYNSNMSPSRQRKRHYSDNSPPPQKRHDSDVSPPRQRKRHDSDTSPPRRKRDDSIISSPRHKRHDSDTSPPRRRRHDSGTSPPRRKRHDSDVSPPRMKKNESGRFLRDKRTSLEKSPYLGRRHDASLSLVRNKKENTVSDSSPLGRQHNSESTSRRLESDDLVASQIENERFKKNNHLHNQETGLSLSSFSKRKGNEHLKATSFKKIKGKIPKELSEEEKALKHKLEEKYQKWNKGVVQDQKRREAVDYTIHEMGKSFARSANDEDMNKTLKDVMRQEDPMLEYISKKKFKENSHPLRPKYKGSFPPNRFNIAPGYRWDGVDRSSGYEKEWFTKQSSKRATEEESYKWSIEDM